MQLSLLSVTFGLVLFLLVVKAQLLAAATAATRGRTKHFLNKEDADWLGGVHSDLDHPAAQRLFRAHRNDLEALVPFLIVGTLYVISGAAPQVGIAYFTLFLAARLAHSFAYLRSHARLRRMAFTVGWLLTLAIGAHALVTLVARSL